MYVGAKVGEETVVSGTGQLLHVFDMPGLGDDMATYESYKELYLHILPQADVILWVHPADDRMVQFLQIAANDLFVNHLPHLLDRLVFGLNKADIIEPNNWNVPVNVPSQAQLDHLRHREVDFSKKIGTALPRWRGSAITYSAARRYQLATLFKTLLYAVPAKRRWVLEERMSIADFTELIDRRILQAALERTKVAPSQTHEGFTTNEPNQNRQARNVQTPVGQSAMLGPEAVRRLSTLSETEYAELVRDRARLVRFLNGDGISRA